MSDALFFPRPLQEALDQFERYANGELQAREAANAVSAPLYHYTDAVGLKGIVENQQIWFTHYLHLNDPGEWRYGMDIVRAILSEIAGADPCPRRLFCKCVEDVFRPENFHSTIEFYLASFSRESDDLGQWRAYGADGRGFALGLASHLFQVEVKADRKPHENVFVSPVVYGDTETTKLARPAIDRAVSIVEQVSRDAPEMMADKSVGRPFLRELTNHLISGVLIPACLVAKHPAYAHEREVRLMIVGLDAALKPYVETRTRPGEIVPFIRSTMPIRAGGISEIVTGPAVGDAGISGLKTFLRLHRLDADSLVRPSTIPYRPV